MVGPMNVVIVGGHGKIAMRLSKILAERGDSPRGIIRKTEQADELEEIGAEPIVLDIENVDDIDDAFAGADAVVFAAGAGPGSGEARKRTMDLGGAVKLIDAAKGAAISRYVIVSSMGADHPEAASGTFRAYLEAKADADQALRDSGLDYTIVRPGSLTNDRAEGMVDLAERLGRRGSIPREDVAAVLVAVLDAPNTIGTTFEVLSGSTPIDEAVHAL
jgi:uncharacterized protein YbjT (DUF2867 family)